MGLPRPELQIPVYDLFGKERFRLDLGWPHWRLALEYDGEEFHGEDAEEHDEARRKWIGDRGWTCRAYRKAHIFTSSQGFEHEVMGLVNIAQGFPV
jgi:very-short-patch-repair endonuclease